MKRYKGKLTLESAIDISLQILADNADSTNTLEGSLNSERVQAVHRLIAHAQVDLTREHDRAWKRKQLHRGLAP